MSAIKIVAAFCVTWMLSGCFGDGTFEDEPAACKAQDGLTVIENRCVSCHSSEAGRPKDGGVALDTLDDVKTWAANIRISALEDQDMPPAQPLHACEMALLDHYLDSQCVADCTGRECGTDGCSGSCGECDLGFVCGTQGACEPAPVLPGPPTVRAINLAEGLEPFDLAVETSGTTRVLTSDLSKGSSGAYQEVPPGRHRVAIQIGGDLLWRSDEYALAVGDSMSVLVLRRAGGELEFLPFIEKFEHTKGSATIRFIDLATTSTRGSGIHIDVGANGASADDLTLGQYGQASAPEGIPAHTGRPFHLALYSGGEFLAPYSITPKSDGPLLIAVTRSELNTSGLPLLLVIPESGPVEKIAENPQVYVLASGNYSADLFASAPPSKEDNRQTRGATKLLEGLLPGEMLHLWLPSGPVYLESFPYRDDTIPPLGVETTGLDLLLKPGSQSLAIVSADSISGKEQLYPLEFPVSALGQMTFRLLERDTFPNARIRAAESTQGFSRPIFGDPVSLLEGCYVLDLPYPTIGRELFSVTVRPGQRAFWVLRHSDSGWRLEIIDTSTTPWVQTTDIDAATPSTIARATVLKLSESKCGCGVVFVDGDGDGVPDCNDECPDEPAKTKPGKCGCQRPETENCSAL